jgi:hypothetical protein
MTCVRDDVETFVSYGTIWARLSRPSNIIPTSEFKRIETGFLFQKVPMTRFFLRSQQPWCRKNDRKCPSRENHNEIRVSKFEMGMVLRMNQNQSVIPYNTETLKLDADSALSPWFRVFRSNGRTVQWMKQCLFKTYCAWSLEVCLTPTLFSPCTCYFLLQKRSFLWKEYIWKSMNVTLKNAFMCIVCKYV